MSQWPAAESGVVQLPSGRFVRGHSLRRPPEGGPADFTLVLAARSPAPQHDSTTWIPWLDFGLPFDRARAVRLLREAWARSDRERVAITCRGGRGRTGTALACIAVLDGMAPAAAISLVRGRYDRRAIETPWQKRYVATFAAVRSTT